MQMWNLKSALRGHGETGVFPKDASMSRLVQIRNDGTQFKPLCKTVNILGDRSIVFTRLQFAHFYFMQNCKLTT